jgi:uncharacterized repeat protein (TIGR03803 family)
LDRDKAGNLYGVTPGGGSGSACGSNGCGTVFEVDKSGSETLLHSFTGGSDGLFPNDGMFMDKAGNLFGTASFGGDCCGVVFKLTP